MNISQIMTACTQKIEAGVGLDIALEQMAKHNIRHLPVFRDKRFLGLLSQSDVELSKSICVTTGFCPLVEEVCQRDTPIVPENSDVLGILRDMQHKKIECILIKDLQGVIVGVFTTTDVCRFAENLLQQKKYSEAARQPQLL